MKITKKIFCFAVLLLCTAVISVNSLYAQRTNGEISGVVKDQSTQEILPYAVVNVKGTSLYSVTDPDGVFRLTGLSAGEITLQITFIGYAAQEVAVSLNAGERKTIEILMSDAYNALGEVVVSAQRMGQSAAINQRLNSDALVNVVSKDAIRELPDINAAEAIGRLPGTSLTRSGGEGAKVIIRGLDPKFASVSINGISQPATDLNDRSVDLSYISPEMLSGIEVFKSPTADMDADAIAGSVNLVISKASDRPLNQFRIYGGYNGLSEKFNNFRASWDFSRRFMDKKLGVMAQASYDQKDRSAHQINRGINRPDNSKPEDMYFNSLELRKFDRTTKRYGVSAFVDYQFNNAGIYLNNIFNASPRVNFEQREVYNNNRNVDHSLILNENKNYSINTSLGGNFKLPMMKIDWNLTRVQTDSYNPMDFTMNFTGTNMLAQNDKNGDPITWSRINPGEDQKWIEYLNLPDGALEKESTYRGGNFTPDTMRQVNYIAKVDIEIPFQINDKLSGIFKFGGKYQTENRKRSGLSYQPYPFDVQAAARDVWVANDPRNLEMSSTNFFLMSNFYDMNGADIMKGDYHMYSSMPESVIRDWYKYHMNVGNIYEAEYANVPQDKVDRWYETLERIGAAYVMLKLNYGNFLTFVPGLRYEHSSNEYSGIVSTLSNFPSMAGFWYDRTVSRSYGELLPSLHLKIKPVDWMDLRLSTVKTLTRPNYNWLLPRVKYDAANYVINRGNPDLKHATSWNYDASITIYTGKFGLMSFGGYVKNISNMFYQTRGTLTPEDAEKLDIGLPAVSFQTNENYINLDDSWVRGLEFEYNTHFNFLPSPFNRFLLGFNVTRLWSGTYYLLWNELYSLQLVRGRPSLEVDHDRSYYEKMEDRMPTQVDWTSNAWLGFEFKGFSTRVSMSYQGTRLNNISTENRSPAYNSYTGSALRFDFTAKYKINNLFSVLLNLNNLTNTKDFNYAYIQKFKTMESLYGMTGELGFQINL